MVEISLSGSPRKIGFQRGKTLKYAIQLALEHWVYGHAHQWSIQAAHKFGRRMARDMEKRCPALMEEVHATAEGAGLPRDDMLAYVFRAWNALSGHRATLACFSMICQDPKRGTILGGTLDDSPPFYLLETIRPTRGHAFYSVNWAGMPWAGKAMNNKGLAIGQASSFAGTRFGTGNLAFPFDLYARAFFAMRWAIQNAATVAEAIDVLRSFECTGTFTITDSHGDAATLEVCGRLHAIRRPDGDGILTSGVFESPDLIRALLDQGVAHDWEEGVQLSRKAHAALLNARGKSTMEWLAGHLQTEKAAGGWCHDGLQSAFVACSATGEFWVSGYRPCASGFRRLTVEALWPS